MERKLNYMFVINESRIYRLIIILSMIAILAFSGISCGNKFPNTTEIDTVLDKVRSQISPEQKVELLRNLLERLKNPLTTADDHNVKYAMQRLTKIYRETGDESILVAIDNTEIQAGFANFVCGFYSGIKNEAGFKRRYSSGASYKKALERCVGISFSQEEVENLFISEG